MVFRWIKQPKTEGVEIRSILYARGSDPDPVSYTHLRAHETVLDLVCRLLLETKNTTKKKNI